MVPSLDTPVCNKQTKRFAEELKALGDKVAAYTVSTDLPFAQARFCTEASIENIKNLSDAHNHSFGEHYGVLISDLPVPLLARAVFVVDPSNTIRYAEIVPEIAQEPELRAGPRSAQGSRRLIARSIGRSRDGRRPSTDRVRTALAQSSGLIQILRYSTGLPWSWSMSGPSWPSAMSTPPGVIEISASSMVLMPF